MQRVYNIIIKAYVFGIRLTAFFNPKAAAWIKGRKDLLQQLPEDRGTQTEWIWFHAASLGEFEQGRPLIEAIKERFPDYKILLTFFSPSGYEIRKDYPLADYVSYLPVDTAESAMRFIQSFSLRLAVFIKYEFWFNHMQALHDSNIPLVFISARFRPEQLFFRMYGKWFLERLKQVDFFYVQDELSKNLLNSHGIVQVAIAGDTRFDRVFRLASKAQSFPEIETFIGGRKTIVIGSSWPEDENLLFQHLKKIPDDFCFLLAPHDISKKHIRNILSKIPLHATLYSSLSTAQPNARVLIVDTIGMLSQLYQYASFAYVGGGFGQSIHNIQEPVAFGCPVIIGPKHQKFTEAVELIQLGGVVTVSSAREMANAFDDFALNERIRNKASEICSAYAAKSIGATAHIMASIERFL